jgi:methionyl-tRNA synthetase
VDQLRYFMLKAMPFGNDGDFSRERMIETINADLANNIGNLAQRTLSMIQKNCEGRVPSHADYSQQDKEYSANSAHYITIQKHMAQFEYQEAADYIVRLSRACNEYIDVKAPWTLRKEGKQAEMEHVLYVLAENVRRIALLLQPFCPQAAEKILDQLAIPAGERDFKSFEKALIPGTSLPVPEGVFPRLQMEEKKGAA